EEAAVARLLERDRRLIPAIGAQGELIEPFDSARDRQMVTIAGDAGQIDPVRSGDDRVPLFRLLRLRDGKAEVHMVVVGVDPQFPMRRVDMIFSTLLAS